MSPRDWLGTSGAAGIVGRGIHSVDATINWLLVA